VGPRVSPAAPRGSRALRADARRNRARLLEAAEAVFADAGASASTEEISRRAGVGVGTLFRHFPTKDALVQAIVLARVTRLADEADALATAGDPATAFFAFFARTVAESEAKQTYSALLSEGFVDVARVAPDLQQRLRGSIGKLLEGAEQAGTVRADVTVPEVMALLVGAVRAAEHAAGDGALRARAVALILDGLRPARDR
jgi:AcrR family transcriptional regulator